MTNTYKTLNPLGSNNARDLSDNASNFDEYMNSDLPSIKDRFDKRRETLAGNQVAFDDAQEGRAQEFTDSQAERESEFNADQYERDAAFQTFLDGTGWSSIGAYGAGVVITSHTQTVDYLGQPYALKPSIPVSLDNPYVITGNWPTESQNFKLVGDNSLRQELAGPNGSDLISCKLSLTGSIRRSITQRLEDYISVKDFGAVGDGVYRPVSDWYTPGNAQYRGYADLAAVQADYPHVTSATNSIDWAGIQAALDANIGGMITGTKGVYVVDDTLYQSPASTVVGASAGDNIGLSSNEKGFRIKTYGAGVPRIWTDRGLPDTPAGTLVDAPTCPVWVFTGTGCSVSGMTIEGGVLADGSDAWDFGFFNPSVKRTTLRDCETTGKFRDTGFCLDATWSNTNTALQTLHTNTYGRKIPSDQASNEVTFDKCWFHGGNWGVKAKGTNRTDTSANIWSPGGASDFNGINTRIDNDPIGVRPNFPEDSGGYYRDLHNDFQNRHFTNCRIGSQSAYSVFLDRGNYEQFDGLYGESRPDRCVTSLLTKTVDALGPVTKIANSGSEWSGTLALVPTKIWVYLTDTARIDLLDQKLRIGGVMSTPTGSLTVNGVGFDSSAGRAYLITTAITGTITTGQTLTQAAGQTKANGNYYGTDRCGIVSSSGQSGFTVVGGLCSFIGPTLTARYLRLAGMVSTVANHTVTSTAEVSINCDTSQWNAYINRYLTNGPTAYRMRFTGNDLSSYNNADLGQPARPWGKSYVGRRYFNSTVWDGVGTGSPEGVETAGIGSTFRSTTTGKTWRKETGTGNTGWVVGA